MHGHRKSGWNPYLAGALAGVLALASAFATTKVMGRAAYLGASTTYVRAAGLIERQFWPEHAAANAYLQKEQPKVDWQFMLVCGIFVGALIGALTGREFEWEDVPPLWRERFGRHVLKRALGGFLGGAVALFGARLAGGCPSGHGLSGLMQLSVSGLAATVCFFAGGVLAAKYLERSKRG